MPDWIITPWRTQADLLKVRSQLYRLEKNAADERAEAVSRVMAWRLRGHLPHAVESTALLVDAFLHHDIAANSSFSVRAVYSAAFCRFVTGFCDIGRYRERLLEPSSMSVIARQIGMPENFVALRHEATHEELPGEAKIVAACEEALQWLWTIYWSRLDIQPQLSAENELPAVRSQECVELAQKLFKQYRSVKKAAIKKPSTGFADLAQLLSTSVNVLADRCGDEDEVQQAVADDIVTKDWLIPSERQLGSTLAGAFLLWDDLLLRLCSVQPRFIDKLVLSCLHAIDGSVAASEARKEAYARWLERLSASALWSGARKTSSGRIEDTIVRHCCLHPGPWTRIAAAAILDAGSDEFREQWSALIDAMKPSEGSAIAKTQTRAVSNLITSEAMDVTAGWYRAILPPAGPIGVVAAI